MEDTFKKDISKFGSSWFKSANARKKIKIYYKNITYAQWRAQILIFPFQILP